MTTSENTTSATSQPPHYLDAHALVRPNKVALICGEHSLTYAELNAQARRVATTSVEVLRPSQPGGSSLNM